MYFVSLSPYSLLLITCQTLKKPGIDVIMNNKALFPGILYSEFIILVIFQILISPSLIHLLKNKKLSRDPGGGGLLNCIQLIYLEYVYSKTFMGNATAFPSS